MTTLTKPAPAQSPAELEPVPVPDAPAKLAPTQSPAPELAPALVSVAPAKSAPVPKPAPAAEPSTLPAADGRPEPYRFNVTQYYAMGQAEILRDDRVELLEGVIVAMAPLGGRHKATVNRFNRKLVQDLGERAIVQVQGSIVLNYLNSPEPDLALLRERADFYESGFILPSDVLLVIEVSDSTASYDRRVKLPLYARAGIPEVWLAVVQENVRRLEVYTDPDVDGARYGAMRTLGLDDTIAPAAFPDLAVPVGRMLAA